MPSSLPTPTTAGSRQRRARPTGRASRQRRAHPEHTGNRFLNVPPCSKKKNTGNNSHKRWLRRVTSQMGTSWGRNTAGAVTGATRSEPPPAPPHGRALRRDEEEKPKEGRGHGGAGRALRSPQEPVPRGREEP